MLDSSYVDDMAGYMQSFSGDGGSVQSNPAYGNDIAPVGGYYGESYMTGPQGLDVSKLTPEQAAYLKQTDPEAFANGMAHFNETSGQPAGVSQSWWQKFMSAIDGNGKQGDLFSSQDGKAGAGKSDASCGFTDIGCMVKTYGSSLLAIVLGAVVLAIGVYGTVK